jgi:AcrR family transcriptional regulator
VEASQRERIFRATTSAVGEHGYHGTRVADVVWRAGVSRKTFYELFASKEDCFAETYERQIGALVASTLEAYETQTEWVDRLRAALTSLLEALAREPDVARLCFVEAIAAGDAVARRRDTAMEALASLFDTPEGSARPLVGALRMGRIGELSEAVRHEVVAGRTERLPELVPDLMYAMVLPFAGIEAAERELGLAGTEQP